MTIQTADTISIILASAHNSMADAASGLVVAHITGEVVEITEKAIKIEAQTKATGKTVTAWFPRKAIKIGRENKIGGSNAIHHTAQIAPWFRPEGWTAKFIEITGGL